MTLNVSLIVIVEKIEKNFLNECIDSLLHQSLENIEIICVSREYNKILENYSQENNKIKIIYSKEPNLKNDLLKYINGEYVSFINGNDWIDFDYCEKLYEHAKKYDSDVSFFKLINFENEMFIEDFFFNFYNFEEKLEQPFTHKEISDIIFEIPHTIYNKFFKTKFIKNIPFKFIENEFDDLPLFFDIILNARKITLLNEHIYFKRIDSLNFPINENIISNLIKSMNIIFSIFKKNNFFDYYKKDLFNYRTESIRYWYSLLNDELKYLNFDLIKDDFSSVNYKIDENFNQILETRNLFFYTSVIKASNFEDLELIYELKNVKLINKKLYSKNDELNSNYTNKNKELNTLKETIKQKEKTLNNLNKENTTLKENITNKYQTITNKNKELNTLKETIKQKEKTLNNLNQENTTLKENITNKNKELNTQKETIKQKEKTLNNLNQENTTLKENITNKDQTITDLNNTLLLSNDELKLIKKYYDEINNELTSKNQIIQNLIKTNKKHVILIDKLKNRIKYSKDNLKTENNKTKHKN